MSLSLGITSRQKHHLLWLMVICCGTCQITCSKIMIIGEDLTDTCFWSFNSSSCPAINLTCPPGYEILIGKFCIANIKYNTSSTGYCKSYCFNITNNEGKYEVRMDEMALNIEMWFVPNPYKCLTSEVLKSTGSTSNHIGTCRPQSSTNTTNPTTTTTESTITTPASNPTTTTMTESTITTPTSNPTTTTTTESTITTPTSNPTTTTTTESTITTPASNPTTTTTTESTITTPANNPTTTTTTESTITTPTSNPTTTTTTESTITTPASNPTTTTMTESTITTPASNPTTTTMTESTITTPASNPTTTTTTESTITTPASNPTTTTMTESTITTPASNPTTTTMTESTITTPASNPTTTTTTESTITTPTSNPTTTSTTESTITTTSPIINTISTNNSTTTTTESTTFTSTNNLTNSSTTPTNTYNPNYTNPYEGCLKNLSVDPEKICKYATYENDTCCGKNESRYVMHLNGSKWTCVTCDDGRSTTITPLSQTITIFPTTMPTLPQPEMNFTLSSGQNNGDKTDPKKAAESLEKLESLVEQMEKRNKTNAAIFMGDVIGVLQRQPKNTATKNISICYSSSQNLINVVESNQAGFPWSVKIPSEAFNKSRQENNGSAFVGVLRFKNMVKNACAIVSLSF
ncbi:mucin-2-like [Carassius carassius]|uniref:mucin-2-like n=1 Tax=Carassius carassius TaxID=217509 RepID=UPI00286963A7|nr:mucin-2-like [Carassius carassius]